MVGPVPVYSIAEACELLSDPAFSDHIFTEPFNAKSGVATIIPLEQALAERFECDVTADGVAHLSFGLDSTWQAINRFYRQKQIARPEHVYAGFDASIPDVVHATYIVPFSAMGQDKKAVETVCKYDAKDIVTRGNKYHKLSRQTTKRPTVVDNPFYVDKPLADEARGRVSDRSIIAGMRRRGTLGTV